MTIKDKKAYRDAAVRGIPFMCGVLCIQAIPFDDLSGTDCCFQCEMDSECKGDIYEMCEFVNGFKDDEFSFKIVTLDNQRRRTRL